MCRSIASWLPNTQQHALEIFVWRSDTHTRFVSDVGTNSPNTKRDKGEAKPIALESVEEQKWEIRTRSAYSSLWTDHVCNKIVRQVVITMLLLLFLFSSLCDARLFIVVVVVIFRCWYCCWFSILKHISRSLSHLSHIGVPHTFVAIVLFVVSLCANTHTHTKPV